MIVFFFFFSFLYNFTEKAKVNDITVTTYNLQSTIPINIAYNTINNDNNNNNNNNNNNDNTTNRYNSTTAANTLF